MRKKLLPEHKKAIEEIKEFIINGKFYLAGGTAVYYYLEHRESIDLDFFSSLKLNFLKYQYLFKPHRISSYSEDTIHAEIKNINMSFFHYPYVLIAPLSFVEIIPVASLEDILCMKINAIIGRGSKRDFIDVFFIMKELSLSAEDCIRLFNKKFGDYNPLIIYKAMSYFKDADEEPELKMIKKIDWEEIKKFFRKEFSL